MGRILAIARNTFRENIRDKVLYNLILFALIMILSSIALGQLTLGHEKRVIIDLGLSVMSMFGTIVAIFIGISLVYKEIERRTVYALLAKPVCRWEFIAGKYLGLLTTLLVNVLTMTAFLAATLLYHGGVNASEMLRLLPAVHLIFLSLALTTAMALVFSTFSTPALSALFTLFLWGIGHFSNDLLDLGKLAGSVVLEKVTRVLYYVLPNLANFTTIDSRNVIQSAAYYQPVSAAAIAWVTAYGVIYSSVLVAIAAAVFARKEFK
jgi:ABC-type transport system involved in multi-copper enzyme maturation permease subunit